MFYLDPLWFVFALPGLIVMLWAQAKVSGTYRKYSKVPNLQGLTGAQVASRLLRDNGLDHVKVEATRGQLTDHYDPRTKVLRLSQGVYDGASVAALGIVAHEVGHAVQDASGYVPMRLRSGLVPAANLGSWMGYIFFIIGFLLRAPNLVWMGVFFFTGAVAFSLVTLPVELNASSRARRMLQGGGLVSTVEYDAASAVLAAAAWTYVGALLQAVGQLLYYVMIAVGMGRRD